ncbi:recombinase RecT, partial [Salmonella enterica subsp. enterica serovar Holcomb]
HGSVGIALTDINNFGIRRPDRVVLKLVTGAVRRHAGHPDAERTGREVTHWEEMAKKTAIRRLFKYLPVSIEIQRAVSMDEKETLTIDPADASVITGEYSVVENAGVEENVTA